MAFDAVNAALELKCDPTMKLVLAVLGKFQNPRTRLCCPAQSTLAEATGLGVSTVKRTLRKARRQGRIAVESGKVNHETSLYTLNFLATTGVARTPVGETGVTGNPAEEQAGVARTPAGLPQVKITGVTVAGVPQAGVPVGYEKESTCMSDSESDGGDPDPGSGSQAPEVEAEPVDAYPVDPAPQEAPVPLLSPPALDPIIKPEWEPAKKLARQFWLQMGRMPRFSKPPYPAQWKGIFRGLAADLGEETCWGILSFLRTGAGGWWTDFIIKQRDPCEYLAKVLKEDKPGSLRHKYEAYEAGKEKAKARNLTSAGEEKENAYARPNGNRTGKPAGRLKGQELTDHNRAVVESWTAKLG
jgi:hypothetical protein